MKHVLAQLKQYKKDTFLTIGFTILEVILEVLLPFITAKIIDDGLQQSNMSVILFSVDNNTNVSIILQWQHRRDCFRDKILPST